MELTYRQLKTLSRALHYAKEWKLMTLDTFLIKTSQGKDGKRKRKAPNCFRKDVRALKHDIKTFDTLRETIVAEVQQIQQNKLEPVGKPS